MQKNSIKRIQIGFYIEYNINRQEFDKKLRRIDEEEKI
jgi:hypothetical protein